MAKSFISERSVRLALKDASPGAFTPDSVLRAREVAEDLVRDLARESRSLAEHAGRKRVTAEEVKMAARYLLKR